MDKIRGFPIYHAIKQGVTPAEYKEKENKKIKKISTNRLIKSYLCSGADSNISNRRARNNHEK